MPDGFVAMPKGYRKQIGFGYTMRSPAGCLAYIIPRGGNESTIECTCNWGMVWAFTIPIDDKEKLFAIVNRMAHYL